MSNNLKKRVTTGPKTSFVSCTQLPVREVLLSSQDMLLCEGGNTGKAETYLMIETGKGIADRYQRMYQMPTAGGSPYFRSTRSSSKKKADKKKAEKANEQSTGLLDWIGDVISDMFDPPPGGGGGGPIHYPVK